MTADAGCVPLVTAELRPAIADLCEQLRAVVNGEFGRVVASPSQDPLVQHLAHLANWVVAAGQEALQRAQARERDLRDAHRIARIGTWRLQMDTGVLHWSDELHHLFGTDPASFVPTHDRIIALIHPDDRGVVLAEQNRARTTGDPVEYEYRVPQPDGTMLWRFVEVRVERGSSGLPIALRGVVQDITDRKDALQHIYHLAHFDALTGLANRTQLSRSLGEHVARARRVEQRLAVLTLDLDGFKAINELHGHTAGDRLLQLVADRLRAGLREGDTVARLGADEFAIVQTEVGQPEGARHLAERLVGLVGLPYDLPGLIDPACITVSIGIALFPDDVPPGEDASAALLAAASTALIRVQRGGRNSHAFFQAALDGQQRARHALEHDLRQALPRGELSLAFQPQADAATGIVVGFEALLRWTHPLRGTVSPAAFIPVAEATGVIVPIGAWVLRQACKEAARWHAPLRIAVNVSALQIQQDDLPGLVALALAESGLDPARLEIEVTESVLLGDAGAPDSMNTASSSAIEALRRVRDQGVRVAMDDFGTGYSSLASLRAFPFDKIKLDRGFVADLGNSEDADAIVRAVLGLGRGLNLPVVAEGVETADQAAALRAGGCDELQGYLIGRPLPISAYSLLTSPYRLSVLAG